MAATGAAAGGAVLVAVEAPRYGSKYCSAVIV